MIPDSLVRIVCARLAANRRVRRTLPGRGRLHIDRPLPFLCVYRRPPNGARDPGTDRLVSGEASYLVAPWEAAEKESVSGLARGIVEMMSGEFGASLLLEIWAQDEAAHHTRPLPDRPLCQVMAPRSAALSATIDALVQGLSKIEILKRTLAAEVLRVRRRWPPELGPLVDPAVARKLNCTVVGLAVPPIYRDPKSGQPFPLVLRTFRRRLGHALKPAFHQFARTHTTHQPPHYHEMGRRAMVKAVWEVDRRLSDVSSAFDFLLQLTPINSGSAWQEFKRSSFKRAPVFYYRPMPHDPAALKRKLYKIQVDRVEDPALQSLFQEKQDELDRKLTMLRDRDTPRFLYGSLQLYGSVERDQVDQAVAVLRGIGGPGARSLGRSLNANEFAARARADFEAYRAACPAFTATARVTSRVAGVMVSRGVLLINPNTTVAESRLEALLAHEVGTHLLIYFNGRAQPFRQLFSGLAGYEELQEGLAVLAEFLVGGLDERRLRQLAARVVAAHRMIHGAPFVEVFHELSESFGVPARSAFSIAMRVFRGGGLTKDAVYLKGLSQMLAYLHDGGELDPLFVGRIGIDHVPVIRELRLRGVLRDPPLQPAYLSDAHGRRRLASLRQTPRTVSDLIARASG